MNDTTSGTPQVSNAGIEPRYFRETLGHYPTGVVVVTATTPEDGPIGMVVGSFTSVSLDPPLVAFMPRKGSSTFERLRRAESFCVNVLAADQEQLCRRLAAGGGDQFADIAWTPAPSGAPVIDDVVAWIDCTYESVVDAGDHLIVLGRVGSMDVLKPALPLVFFQGGYGRFSLPSLIARSNPDLIHSIRLAEHARDQIEAIADELGAECSVLAPVGEDAVVVALATRTDEPSHVSLGFHVPLVPPLGTVFISHLGSVAINAWLSRIDQADEETQASYISQLERVRERGYSLSLRGPHSQREIYDAARAYSSVDRLPEHERHFRDIIRDQAHLYEPDLDPDGTYDLHSIVVPVQDPIGVVQIALRLANTPRDASGRDVLRWIERLRQATEVVAERLYADQSAALLADAH